RWLESKTCPIALADVIAALRDAREVQLAGSTWFDIPGPDVLSARELLSIVAALEGRHVPSVRVPVLTPRLSAMWLKLVSRADYALARELVLGLTADLLPQRSFWGITGHPPRWTFREAAASALATEVPPSRIARVVEGLVRRVGPHKRPEHDCRHGPGEEDLYEVTSARAPAWSGPGTATVSGCPVTTADSCSRASSITR
ncbi:MAG TPA: hypothetical protein VHW23_24400, partial [Kofleriaceae bacterium]|nr:hypothetical protein [Kofleriaceae bacterium]